MTRFHGEQWDCENNEKTMEHCDHWIWMALSGGVGAALEVGGGTFSARRSSRGSGSMPSGQNFKTRVSEIPFLAL
jgi:hypothetical protein